jgi:hypothetical protein
MGRPDRPVMLMGGWFMATILAGFVGIRITA